MRHKHHMTNSGRLRNPPQKEEENSEEEMTEKKKTNPPHLLAGGFLLSPVKSSQGKSVRTGRHLGEKTRAGAAQSPAFPRKALSGRQSRQTELFDLWELFGERMTSEKHKQRSSSGPASSSFTCY